VKEPAPLPPEPVPSGIFNVTVPVNVEVLSDENPVVVAFKKKALVEDTVPAAVTLPVASTLNLVEEFTCRSMKLPTNVGTFAPMYVPVALPPTMLYGPSWIRALVDVA
jgi:hypothetical protein